MCGVGELRESVALLDLGCGLGLLAFCLREHGLTVPIHGIDYDERNPRPAGRRRGPGLRG